MEFNKQYLTWKEYQELGGTLDEAPFNILELEAQKSIDRYTFGRLVNLQKQINEVKVCTYRLIGMLDAYAKSQNKDKSISGESIDGYSVNYGQTATDISKTKENDTRDIIKTYLSGCYLEDGTTYLYVGGVIYDNKHRYNLL